MLFFAIIIILISVILGLFVLIQNPKGGGLAGTFGGVGNQLMGVKQTTDVLEKGTWILAGAVALLCLLSPAFIPKESRAASKGSKVMDEAPANLPAKSNTGTTAPMPGTATPDTNK